MRRPSSIHDPRHKVIPAVLRQARLKLRLTQKELAEKMGVTRLFISKTESGDRNLTALELIDYCAAVEINVLALISGITNQEFDEGFFGKKVSTKDFSENDMVIKSYALGFLHGAGETSVDNPISARIVHRENKPEEDE